MSIRLTGKHFKMMRRRGVNFINILRAAFCSKVFRAALLYLYCKFVLFWRREIGAKAVRKMLVKLTREGEDEGNFEISRRKMSNELSLQNVNWRIIARRMKSIFFSLQFFLHFTFEM